jgi:hypothetical protein
MRVLVRSGPVLVVLGLAVAGCNNSPGTAGSPALIKAPCEITGPHQVILDVTGMH